VNIWKTALGAAMCAGLLIAVACGGGGDEKTIDLGDGDEVTLGTDLPDDFPDDFPVYDGADLQGAVQGEQDGIQGIVATWTSGDDFSDISAYYEDAFQEGPWISDTKGSAGGSTYWSVTDGGDQVGYIIVSQGDEVTIVATVGDDPNVQSGSGDDDGSSDDGGSDGSDDGSSDDGSSDDGSSDGGSDDDGGSSDDVSLDLPDEVEPPDGYPSDRVPLPDDIRVTAANSFSANGQDTYIVGFYTKDSAKDIGDFYKGELEGQGFTQSFQTSDANGTYATYSENSDGTGLIVAISVNESATEGYREGVVQVTTS
jgi:hypothetical protein